jgi:hypothetical protein
MIMEIPVREDLVEEIGQQVVRSALGAALVTRRLTPNVLPMADENSPEPKTYESTTAGNQC